MEAHDAAVAAISAAAARFYAAQQPFRIYHGATNSTRAPQYARNAVIDTSGLNRVLSIDADLKVASVEPNVTMRQLVRATLPHGLMPPVVMELPEITVGGGFAGNSGESSSFRHGLFDCTVQAIEVVLASGEVVQASAERNADLFYGAAGSYGTLGVITRLDVGLIPAAECVEMTYHPVDGVAAAVAAMRDLARTEGVQFVDAILYGPTEGLVIAGRPVSAFEMGGADYRRLPRFLRARDPQYYLHARRQAARRGAPGRPAKEATPLEDYLFRYDRGGFWVGRYAFRYFGVPYNRVSRFLLDRFMHAQPMFHALHESGLAERYVVQDISVPIDCLEPFVDYIHRSLDVWPLWLCPIAAAPSLRTLPRFMRDPGPPAAADKVAMFVNVGIWGPGSSDPATYVELNRGLERKAQELRGAKALYARSYYTEDEFWTIYDRTDYEILRAAWKAESLPSIFDKMKAGSAPAPRPSSKGLGRIWHGMWRHRPLAGFRGVVKLMTHSDYLFAKPAQK